MLCFSQLFSPCCIVYAQMKCKCSFVLGGKSSKKSEGDVDDGNDDEDEEIEEGKGILGQFLQGLKVHAVPLFTKGFSAFYQGSNRCLNLVGVIVPEPPVVKTHIESKSGASELRR